jgi:hypothetical protein
MSASTGASPEDSGFPLTALACVIVSGLLQPLGIVFSFYYEPALEICLGLSVVLAVLAMILAGMSWRSSRGIAIVVVCLAVLSLATVSGLGYLWYVLSTM